MWHFWQFSYMSCCKSDSVFWRNELKCYICELNPLEKTNGNEKEMFA